MATITKYSHHYVVAGWDHGMRKQVTRFAIQFQQYSTRYQKGVGVIREKQKIFAESDAHRTNIRLHINTYDDFIQFMTDNGYPSYRFNIVEVPMYTPATCKPKMPSFMKPRDYQEPQIEYACSEGIIKIITMQTGKGKTFCALEAIRRRGVRTLISVPAKYLQKWKKDVIEAYGSSVELCVVQGGSQLRSLLALGKAGELTADIILCSSNTIALYFKEYRGNSVFTYEVPPYKMFETLGVGIRLIDEVHDMLHFNYRFDCYSHVPVTISLSATIISRDETVNRVVEYMFPSDERAPEMEYDRYTDVFGLGYRVLQPNLIKCKQRGMYSHNQYEQWLLKDESRTASYLDMVFEIIKRIYVDKGNLKQKVLVYAASVDMCKLMATEFAKLYPDLEVTTKVQDDDLDVLDTAQVTFSTLLSTGTAVDIADLAYVVMTTAVDSDTANLQAIGRLRRMKNYPEQTPEFYYLCCIDIDKHMVYHNNKKKLFMERALHHRWIMTNVIVS